jgi:hypothetical protein
MKWNKLTLVIYLPTYLRASPKRAHFNACGERGERYATLRAGTMVLFSFRKVRGGRPPCGVEDGWKPSPASPAQCSARQARAGPRQSHRSPPAFTAPQAGSVEGLAVEGRACMSLYMRVWAERRQPPHPRRYDMIAIAIAINGP